MEELKEMITPVLRKNLEKQGYRLIGSHSGVKLCRWTKVGICSYCRCAKDSVFKKNIYLGF